MKKVFADFEKELKNKPKDISEITKIKLEIARRNSVFKVSDQLKDLHFNIKKRDSEGYITYVKGFKIKDIGSECIGEEGLSIFKAKATKDLVIDLHDHKTQSQTILVQKGKIILLDSNLEIYKGESFFIKKKKKHMIKYTKGTEVLIVYLPNLERIK